MPFLALLANWKLIAFGLLIAALPIVYFVGEHRGYGDGKEDCYRRVEQQAARQREITNAATVAALETINAENTRRERIITDALAKITRDCAVDPAVIDAFDRLRRTTRPGEGNDTNESED